nr:PREDICTED: kinesin-like protein KIF13A [Latimeria chalumnae]|eukprot:XP_006006836.2 PREDICTED: kinesin-like protein KIF13A [Latimeria chalumnae]
MEENQTILHQQPPSNTKGDNRKPPKVFAFDYCFWSMDESNTTKYAGQEVVFKCLGEGILENAFQGYNACIFAYGQTGKKISNFTELCFTSELELHRSAEL